MRSEGIYNVKATQWGLTETTNGHPQFWMTFTVLNKQNQSKDDLDEGNNDTQSGIWSITITDNSINWLLVNLRSLGYDRDDLLGLNPDLEGAFNFEGVEFLAKCKHGEFNNEPCEKWSVVAKPKLSVTKLEDINKKYAHMFQEANQKRPVSPQTEAVSAGTENVPF